MMYIFMYQNYNFCMYVSNNVYVKERKNKKDKCKSIYIIKVCIYDYISQVCMYMICMYRICIYKKKEKESNMLKDIFYLVKDFIFPPVYDEYGEPVKMEKGELAGGICFMLLMFMLFFIAGLAE